MSRRAPTAALVAALCSLVVTGCGSTAAADLDLCQQYDEFSDQVAELREVEPASTSVDDVRRRVESFQASLDQLQAVAEGQLDRAISDLRTAANEVAQSAVSAGQEAADNAHQAMEDSLENLREKWAVLQQAADNQCT